MDAEGNAPAQESLAEVAARLDHLIQGFEQHPNQAVRDQALEMLALVDALHREGVRRLVEVLWQGSPTVLAKALADEAVTMLLQLYDLAPLELDPLEEVQAALESVRPYIASHGGAVEVLDVVEGIVHLRLSGACQGCAGSAMTLKRGIEAALREGFPGFQGIEVHEPVAVPQRGRGGFIPLQAVGEARPLNRPVFTAAGSVESLPPGSMQGIVVAGKPILLCNVAGEIYAYRNACPGSDLPLDGGRLRDFTLLCPWHNCVFDARTGKRLDGESGRLDVIPVAIREGTIQLALNVAPVALG
ncbi:MAG TPA: NifU family protein [Chloroflexia bacterium]|jgi:Fe-S cluster biogenesis protein NfuA/nitrite reductase/ring-hydroxylating ferredoxin subunit|nr:NifU family protein [Chloroflexia bacterium]